ncbi:MAG: CooT family nickel-binding protein [Deltaproteobacteria bacterium]|nr:CooT family nickel-binding protein [Deltaproteobacteria bacterium]
MCESTAYVLKDGKEEVFFEDVDALENKNNEIKLVNIFGETKMISAKIKQFSLVDHKILLEPC